MQMALSYTLVNDLSPYFLYVSFKISKIKNTAKQLTDQIFKNEASVWSYCNVNKLHSDMTEVFSIKLIVEIRHFKICGSC